MIPAELLTGLRQTQTLDHRRGAYKARDDQGRTWFAKPPHPNAPGKLKFAEVVVATMAKQIGLRWPLTIPHRFDNGYGVLVAWVDGLQPPVPESGLFPDDWEQMLARYQNLEQLAGFTVFSRWCDAGDNKNDVLQVDSAGQFWFLDGEYWLGNHVQDGWKFGSAVTRGAAFNGFDFANSLTGRPLSLFSPWLKKLPSLAHIFEEACGTVPMEWLPMPAELDELRKGLFGNADHSYFSALFEGSVKDESGENDSRW